MGRGIVFIRRCCFDDAKRELKVAQEILQKSNYPDSHSILQKIKDDIARVEHEENLCV